jgi:hypothetical protein
MFVPAQTFLHLLERSGLTARPVDRKIDAVPCFAMLCCGVASWDRRIRPGLPRRHLNEVVMISYLLLLLGVVSRYLVAGHLPLLNFTAVTGSLLYFGARRPWREMLAPLAVFMLSDYCLTTYTYHYAFHWQSYGITWTWYVAVMVLGSILLKKRTTFARGAAGALLGPTSFWLVSDYSVWVSGFNGYPHTLAGLGACYVAAIVLGVALGVPVLVRRMNVGRTQGALAGK